MSVLLCGGMVSKPPADTAMGSHHRRRHGGSGRLQEAWEVTQQGEDSAILTLASSLFPELGKVAGGRSPPAPADQPVALSDSGKGGHLRLLLPRVGSAPCSYSVF